MNIAVIGAHGRTGRAFISTALAAGHTIRAGARGQSQLINHPQLQYVECDATKYDQLLELCQEQDAVVSLLGHNHHSPADVQTVAMELTIQAMHELGIRRIISLTGTGVRCVGDHIPIIDTLLTALIRRMDKKRIEDGTSASQLLMKSDLDWTILRALKLTNGTPRAYALSEHGPTRIFTSRATVAISSLSLLEDGSYNRMAVVYARRVGTSG